MSLAEDRLQGQVFAVCLAGCLSLFLADIPCPAALLSPAPAWLLVCSHPPQTVLPHSISAAARGWQMFCRLELLGLLLHLPSALLLGHLFSAPLLDQYPFLSSAFKYKKYLVLWSLFFPLESASHFFGFAIIFKNLKEACMEAPLIKVHSLFLCCFVSFLFAVRAMLCLPSIMF